MRLLLDECVPRPLLRDLSGHDVHHVVDMGWSSKRNGELLQLMLAERDKAILQLAGADRRGVPGLRAARANALAVIRAA